MRRLEGVVQLPTEAFVAEDVLGATFTGSAAAAAFELAFPRLPVVTGSVPYALQPPYPVDEVIRSVIERNDLSWGYASNRRRMPDGQERAVAWRVEQLAIKITFEDADDGVAFYDLADRFGGAFNAWYGIVLDWTQLWTDAIAPLDFPLAAFRSHLRDVDEPVPGGVTGWGGIGGLGLRTGFLQTSESALDRRMLTRAFALADASDSPPLEWELFLRARRDPDRRIGVIEAATATEVALTRAFGVELPHIAPSTRDLIVKNANGLVGLLRLLESMEGVEQRDSLVNRVSHQLANPRNDAVHRGSSPANPDKAFFTARAVLDRHSPLPRSSGVEFVAVDGEE